MNGQKQVPSVADRLARTVTQLIIAIEEKAEQLEHTALYIAQLEASVADLKTQLDDEKAKVLALSAEASPAK